MEAIQIASTVFSALGALQQANSRAGEYNAQAASYDAQRQANERNAAVLAQNAQIERQQSNEREEAQRREARMILGQQRASLAQAGTGFGGTAADVMSQSAANAELDALTLRYEGDMRARGLLAQADEERYQGSIAGVNASTARSSASNARSQGYVGAIGSILGGVGSYMGYRENKRLRTETLNRIR